MLCKTCKRAVIRVYEGEEKSHSADHGEITEEILCPIDSMYRMTESEKEWGKLTACSKYLPTEATVARENG